MILDYKTVYLTQILQWKLTTIIIGNVKYE